ncbi:hypothetical protein [Aliidiomarina soli]|uniref:Uncharacterized protein n=1 Tax=Aliidiomarina soli TaxID=1928574 RepID=A0A432WHC0_9GAMM|nr:hypothetical protein [Aliidiomarina soli]RUO33178.1 hypothetical protein CWE14_08110 [Aliidiomarina soli]
MTNKILTVLLTVSITLLANFQVKAQQAPLPPGYENDPELTKVCQGISAAVAAVSVFTPGGLIGRSVGAAFAAMNAYQEVTGGRYSASAHCEMGIQDFVKHYTDNPIVYNDWIRTVCGGNPYNCPGTLNVGSPRDCSTYIVCSDYTAIQHRPFSLNDLIAPFAMTELHVQYNTWDKEMIALFPW